MTTLLFATVDWVGMAIAVGIMVGISLVLGVCILLISKLCTVTEDPRIGEVTQLLAGANCGACGYAGCSGYAKALVEGTAKLDACGQTTAENKAQIGTILGIQTDGSTEPTIAVVGCCGGTKCKDKYEYQGYGNCVNQSMLAGGRKACDFGCMGSGSCVDACPYLAVECYDGYAHIDPDLCRSCGMCINACPKKLIKHVPVSATVYVACSSQCRGKDVMSVCETGCIGCGKCERLCPSGAIHLVNNVPTIDYGKCTHCEKCLEGCPRHCIKHVHPQADKVVAASTSAAQ